MGELFKDQLSDVCKKLGFKVKDDGTFDKEQPDGVRKIIRQLKQIERQNDVKDRFDEVASKKWRKTIGSTYVSMPDGELLKVKTIPTNILSIRRYEIMQTLKTREIKEEVFNPETASYKTFVEVICLVWDKVAQELIRRGKIDKSHIIRSGESSFMYTKHINEYLFWRYPTEMKRFATHNASGDMSKIYEAIERNDGRSRQPIGFIDRKNISPSNTKPTWEYTISREFQALTLGEVKALSKKNKGLIPLRDALAGKDEITKAIDEKIHADPQLRSVFEIPDPAEKVETPDPDEAKEVTPSDAPVEDVEEIRMTGVVEVFGEVTDSALKVIKNNLITDLTRIREIKYDSTEEKGRKSVSLSIKF